MNATRQRVGAVCSLAVLVLVLVTCASVRGDGNGALPSPTVEGENNSPTATAAASVTSTPPPSATSATPTATMTAAPTQPAATQTVEPSEAGLDPFFDGQLAFEQLEAQMAFGPRWPGNPGHEAVGDYIVQELQGLGWEVEEQLFEYQGITGRNIIARANLDHESVIILGAHYDTRRVADQTPGAAEEGLPVPGAVDGASGVAVLLELARTLNLEEIPGEVWLAFFDMEDNGGGVIEGWNWIVGSTYMAENLSVAPEAVEAMVLVDMIGDADQQLYYEGNSDEALREALWAIAAELGYGETFIPVVNHTMIDDHLPFARQGIAAVDIIDFDYPYWHTVEDTADKASAASLERVGRTLEVWLESKLVLR